MSFLKTFLKNKMLVLRTLVCGFIFLQLICSHALAQQTVFSLFKNTSAQADAYVAEKKYSQAIEIYKSLLTKSSEGNIELKIARASYYNNSMTEAVNWYNRVLAKRSSLADDDMFLYAEALSATGQYDQAILWYNLYHKKNLNDSRAIKKIWRLQNREYLYEDSIHYVLTALPVNTTENEMYAVACGRDVVFLSNRKRESIINTVGDDNNSFYRMYITKTGIDTIQEAAVNTYSKPELFGKSFRRKYHDGPIAFYKNSTHMVYTTTNNVGGKKNKTLQLMFADCKNGTWLTRSAYSFNSSAYSITDPAISQDGTILYFSSDMKGGYGGRDLYQSTFKNNAWTKPVNLGDQINTAGDETFPFLANQTLYFTSNGLPGLGGLDVFKVPVQADGFGDVVNMGYPVNTNYDDFAITLDSIGVNGFITSNRNDSNDDVYNLSIDLQSYPLTVEGVVKYKEDSWHDSTALKVLPDAALFLIDNQNNTTVQTSHADGHGEFSLVIPYFSQYRIKVVDIRTNDEVIVSMDLSKSRSASNRYEIVVVKNIFKNQ